MDNFVAYNHARPGSLDRMINRMILDTWWHMSTIYARFAYTCAFGKTRHRVCLHVLQLVLLVRQQLIDIHPVA